MKISNNGQFTNLFNRKDVVSFPMNDKQPLQAPDFTVQDKPLTSKSWVTVSNRRKGEPARDTGNYRVVNFGGVWLEKPTSDVKPQSVITLENTIKVLSRKMGRTEDVLAKNRLMKTITRLRTKLELLTKKHHATKKVVKKPVEKIVPDIPLSDRNLRHRIVNGVYHQLEILNIKRAV